MTDFAVRDDEFPFLAAPDPCMSYTQNSSSKEIAQNVVPGSGWHFIRRRHFREWDF